MSWKLSDDPLGQLETAIAEDDMNGANNVVFELTRCGARDLATAYAATERCLHSGNRILRSIGVSALGHIARVWDALDEKFKEDLEQALVDPDRHIRQPAEESAMELYSFLHWHFRNWTPKEEPIPLERRFEDVHIGHLGPVTTASRLVTHHYGNQRRKAQGLPPLPPLPF
ncbi:hypothetical protein CfE428DRAFT_5578 [Chthoniobacter flavus Ellin428]|uniref:Uncharacterized protein n=1 Tax=Chthoniobacter flavus Ellin428 TaxID=497964 RepID=B4D9I8_9BACT|nr:hypothetical protein [Chthoniobacter flavus]EDY16949.1 hypothetical protein CfE428DRAFT_5578 [Chthoniobacter flavus Ellin428]TCO87827.1 hypothetical protein EV701_120126 [Chthoniobacter flavus]